MQKPAGREKGGKDKQQQQQSLCERGRAAPELVLVPGVFVSSAVHLQRDGCRRGEHFPLLNTKSVSSALLRSVAAAERVMVLR